MWSNLLVEEGWNHYVKKEIGDIGCGRPRLLLLLAMLLL
jgi:hypothetical protein